MSTLNTYRSLYNENKDKARAFFSADLIDTIQDFSYLVNWSKVYANVEKVEINLNILNFLIGKDDAEEKMRILLIKYPEVVEVLPILQATRDKSIRIRLEDEKDSFHVVEFNFRKRDYLSEEDIDNIIYYARHSGILDIFEQNKVKNLVDYVMGVEVGMDSNARKNRSGAKMEQVLEKYIQKICNKEGYEYISNANSKKIKKMLNLDIRADKKGREFDFVIKTKNKVLLIETNFFNGKGGSKQKSVIGEFRLLNEALDKNNLQCEFAWVTDGPAWHSAQNELVEAFKDMSNIFNLEMVANGILEELVS